MCALDGHVSVCILLCLILSLPVSCLVPSFFCKISALSYLVALIFLVSLISVLSISCFEASCFYLYLDWPHLVCITFLIIFCVFLTLSYHASVYSLSSPSSKSESTSHSSGFDQNSPSSLLTRKTSTFSLGHFLEGETSPSLLSIFLASSSS